MCTVTLVPFQNGFILTSNRDEHINRKPFLAPTIENGLLFPKDGEAGGTWVAASETGRVVCLLNGAFEKHIREKSYRKSRGLVVKELFEYNSIFEFTEQYNFDEIEPFTLVWVESEPVLQFFEFRWDYEKIHLKELSITSNHIWSSSTLYSSEIKHLRVNWFENWLLTHKMDEDSLMSFHKNAGVGDKENDVIMKRSNGVQTVSTTQIMFDGEEFKMTHENYVLAQKSIEKLKKTIVLK